MTVLEALDAGALRRWCESGAQALAAARTSIDDLNVYPVPDGDTGTNLLLTMTAVCEAVRAEGDGERPEALATVVRAMSRGALLGARGNSGAILSQLIRGLADVFAASEPVRGRELQAALRRAADLAHASVEVPVEGTVLTVARAAADAAAAADPTALADVARAAAAGAAAALDETPEQLDVLAEAGVVDAGGRGLCVLLDALVGVVTGRDPLVGAGHAAPSEPHVEALRLPVPRDGSGVASREAGAAYAYEVQFVLELPPDVDVQATIAELRGRLAALGDSLVVVGGERLWAVHVHVDDAGAAVEAGVEAGRPSRITIVRFADADGPHPAAPLAGAPRPAEAAPRRGEPGRRVIAVVPGAGLAGLARAAGALVVPAEPGSPPSAEELLRAIVGCDAREVVLLPADGDGRAAASAAARAARGVGRVVTVVPVRSVVQSLAALAVADPARPLADDAVAMSSAAAATRWGSVVLATERAQTSAGVCEPGDALGLAEGDVAVIACDVATAARALLDRLLLVGGELATLVVGGQAPAGLGDALAGHLRAAHPGVDVVTYDGGPADVPLLVGVE